MMKKEKTAALLLGITMSLTGTALAAPADTAQDIDSRIAALEQQQSNLEKEIKELRHQNSQLKNQERSQKKQLNGLSKSVKREMDRIKISGFGRVSWDNDNIKGYIDRNDNRRFYLDLKGKFKVNDDWNFNFESETNPRYANYVMADGTLKSHSGHDDEDGTIQRVWAEGKTGVVNYDIGRRWRGLGFQNVLFGNESDGVIVSTAIPKSKLTANAFYLTPTDKGYNFSIYGAGVQGQVGHGLQINAAIAKLNIGKHEAMGQNVYDTTKTFKVEGVNATIKDLHGTLKGGGDFRWYGSKTFNMAGLMFSDIIIRDAQLRKIFCKRDKIVGFVNPLSVAAHQAAYEKCDEWLAEFKTYLDENFMFVKEYLAEHLPAAVFSVPEATYLAWVNLKGCLPDVADLPGFFANNAGVLLEGGNDLFVGNAEGYVRLNLAMPRSIIKTGLERMTEAIEKHNK